LPPTYSLSLHDALPISQLSVAVTTNVTLLEHVPANTFTTRLVEQVIVGGTVSVTVTVKVHVLLLPLASVAVLVTVVVPTAKLLPDRKSTRLNSSHDQIS